MYKEARGTKGTFELIYRGIFTSPFSLEKLSELSKEAWGKDIGGVDPSFSFKGEFALNIFRRTDKNLITAQDCVDFVLNNSNFRSSNVHGLIIVKYFDEIKDLNFIPKSSFTLGLDKTGNLYRQKKFARMMATLKKNHDRSYEPGSLPFEMHLEHDELFPVFEIL